MRQFVLILCGLLLTVPVFAQLGGVSQRGRATQEMTASGFYAAHASIPLDSMAKVVNTVTGKEIEVMITRRIIASSERIVDLSPVAWAALELNVDTIVTLSYTPASPVGVSLAAPELVPERRVVLNEITRLNTTTYPIYHLLILDRALCLPFSDIEEIDNISVLYKYIDGSNGYLIAIYESSQNGPVFPQFPYGSRFILNIMTTRKETIAEYVNSSEFTRFVSNSHVLEEIINSLPE